MKNVGVMKKKQVEEILKMFPPGARITRGAMIIQVRPPKLDTVVFQAATLGHGNWHVRAMPGLLEVKE
jgi:hypothetical protein